MTVAGRKLSPEEQTMRKTVGATAGASPSASVLRD